MTASGALHVEIDQALPMPLHGTYACAPGELVAIVGPSGAGKSSMLRIIAGLMRPRSGRVEAGGEVWCDTASGIFRPAQARRVGLVFQHYALMPHLSATDNVALALLHLPARERKAAAHRWLRDLQLSDDESARKPEALSGGQQQRVALARALARKPVALLLDEPFSAVDQMSREVLYQLLADLRRDLQVPTLLVTHDLAEARLLADRLVVIDAGQVLQQGTPGSIHRAPRNARVADLVGIRNRFDGVWLGAADEPGWGWLRWNASREGDGVRLKVRDKGRLPDGQRVTWLIPSEGIALLDGAPRRDGEFAARVTEVRHLGEMTLATLELVQAPFGVFRLTIAGPDGQRIAVAAARTIALDLGAVHVMPVRGGAPAPVDAVRPQGVS